MKADPSVQSSRALLYQTLDSLPELIWICGTDQACLWFNRSWLSFTGHTLEKEIADGWAAMVHPEDLESSVKIYCDAFEKRLPFETEYRLRHHDGEYHWVFNSGLPMTGLDGEFVGFIGSCFDIHRRKLDSEALSQSEANLGAAEHRAGLGSWTYDVETGKTWWSKEMYRLHGMKPGEEALSLDQYFAEMIHPDDQEMITRLKDDVLASPRAVTVNCRTHPKLGSVRRLSIKSEVVFNDKGTFSGFAGTALDVTEREEALRQSAVYRTIFEQAAVGVALIDSKTGEFLEINKRYCDLVGYDHDEMSGSTFQKITHPDDLGPDLEQMERLRAGEIREFSMEKRYFHKSGSICWVNLTVSATWQPGEEPRAHIAIVEDITEKRNAEEQASERLENVVQLTRRIETIQEEEAKYISREIHDELGQTMTALKMGLHHLEVDILNLPATAHRNRLEDRIVQSSGLIDESIDFVRKIALRVRPNVLDNIGLPAALRQECEEFEEHHKLTCRFAVDSDFPPLNDEVETGLFRVSQELLTNIARHAKASEVDLRLTATSEAVTMELKDDGMGFSVGDARKKGHLGLLGVEERVHNMNGKLSLKSEPGQGTIITASIPLDHAVAEA